MSVVQGIRNKNLIKYVLQSGLKSDLPRVSDGPPQLAFKVSGPYLGFVSSISHVRSVLLRQLRWRIEGTNSAARIHAGRSRAFRLRMTRVRHVGYYSS